jgi:hypothetical protein
MNEMQNLPRTRSVITDAQYRTDSDHLRLLSIFHFVVGGLGVLGMAFLGLHFLFFQMIFANPAMWKGNPNPPPEGFFQIFQWFYLFMGLMLAVGSAINLLSGWYLLQRKYRTFSLVVAGLDCLQIPFGTILGVFTIVVLTRESVRESYEVQQAV